MSHPLLFLPLFFFIITTAAAATNISAFLNCPPSDCNGLKISYPFWKIDNQTNTAPDQYCGYADLGINCSTISGVDRPTPMMYFGGDFYYVRNLTDTSITLVDYHVSDVFPLPNGCPRVKHRIELESLPLNFTSNNLHLSFHFNCTSVLHFAHVIPCLNRSYVNVIRPETPDYDWENMCAENVITMVIDVFGNSTERPDWKEFVTALRTGFELSWEAPTDACEKCEESDGLCGYNNSTGSFMCFCDDGSSTRNDCKVGSSNAFSVKNVKKCVFEVTNVIPPSTFEWCNWVPKKVVVVAWRAFLYRLPTVDALSRRNIQVGSQLCSICETNMESVDHLFTGCPVFMEVWHLVFSWCQVPSFFAFHVRDLLCLHLTAKSGTRAKKAFYGVILTAVWSIWKARNDHIFNQKEVSVRRITEEIKVMSFLWITKRGRMTDMTWDSWGRFDSLKMG